MTTLPDEALDGPRKLPGERVEALGPGPEAEAHVDARIAAIAADRDYWREQALAAQPAAEARPVALTYPSRQSLFLRACGHPSVLEIMADCADCIDTENDAQHDPECGAYDGSKWRALAAELRRSAAAIRAEDPEIWSDAPPARPVAPAGWLPIETAPADESLVLAWVDWKGNWVLDINAARHSNTMPSGSGLSNAYAHGSATHWMPLPPPPGASPAAPAPVAPYRAEKIGGSFQHTGTVVAEFRTLAGEERIVLEFDPPVAGMLHVYRPDQVSRIATESQAETAPVAPVALTEEHTFEPISDDEQAALYRHCEGTDHYSVVRRLYRNSCKLPPDLFERERAATICDDLAEMMERGAGECAPGERLRQAARNIREGRPPLSDVCISAPSAEG